MRAFQGTFHANPDYALWYGWSEMQRDLAEIKEGAAALRREHAAKTVARATPAKPAALKPAAAKP
jgi:hydroxylamine dehydrogenase